MLQGSEFTVVGATFILARKMIDQKNTAGQVSNQWSWFPQKTAAEKGR